jgi:RNA polymerase sigma-54 factor
MAGMELSFGVAQQQSLSPQMQQSLQLLQTPVAELRQMVSAELASNPVLEEDPPGLESQDSQEVLGDQAEDEEESREQRNEHSLQDEWRDYLPQSASPASYSAEDEERRRFLFDSQTSRQTLRNFVIEQAAGFPSDELRLVEFIAGSLDEDGYLRVPLSELSSSGGVSLLALEKALTKVREFEPAGVGAADCFE